MDDLPRADRDDLSRAKRTLENPSLAIQLADWAGKPIDALVKRLPSGAQESIAAATRRALDASLTTALRTLDREQQPPSNWLHRSAVIVTGAVGGAAGLAGLVVELPISLTVMLRSIAEQARAQGEDLAEVATRLECLSVFAYGSRSITDDAADSAYFATRAAMARAVGQAAEFVAQRGVADALGERSAPALVGLITRIAQRFGLSVADKAAAQLVPIIGAAGGAAVNALFIDHYQETARAHFTVRRLERAHGLERIRKAYAEASSGP
jgi:hypothetical protein